MMIELFFLHVMMERIFLQISGRHTISAYGDRLSSPTPTATDSPIGITTENPD